MTDNLDARTFANMQAGEPYATYEKTILGKAYVTILNPFSNQPEGLLLEGEKGTDSARIDVWSEVQDLFFRRTNKRHLEQGIIIKVKRPVQESQPPTLEQASDETLKEILNKNYAALLKVVSAQTSEALIYRLLELAREMEKSDRIIKALESKLSELQLKPANMALTR